jgi:hypothetical protein
MEKTIRLPIARQHGCNKVDGQSNRVGATGERSGSGRTRVALYQNSKLQIIDSGEATEGLPYTILPHFVTALARQAVACIYLKAEIEFCTADTGTEKEEDYVAHCKSP